MRNPEMIFTSVEYDIFNRSHCTAYADEYEQQQEREDGDFNFWSLYFREGR